MRLLSQSGCSLSVPAVRAWRLLPVKLGVAVAASARIIPFSFSFFFYPARQSGNTGNFLTFLPSFPSLSSPPCPFAHSAVCVSIAASHQINLHLPQPPGRSITNFTSRLCLSVDGFEVCCEMCGWGKKNLFSVKKKNDNLSFFQSRFSVCRDGFALRSVTKRL